MGHANSLYVQNVGNPNIFDYNNILVICKIYAGFAIEPKIWWTVLTYVSDPVGTTSCSKTSFLIINNFKVFVSKHNNIPAP